MTTPIAGQEPKLKVAPQPDPAMLKLLKWGALILGLLFALTVRGSDLDAQHLTLYFAIGFGLAVYSTLSRKHNWSELIFGIPYFTLIQHFSSKISNAPDRWNSALCMISAINGALLFFRYLTMRFLPFDREIP